jgi:uncharacterized protein (DUF1330 family)
MSALWISHVTVTDPVAYKEYATRAVPVIAEFGGQFLSRGAAFKHIEGTARDRHLIVRFADISTAEACYNSDAYQAALAFAKDASIRDLVIVEETH